VVIAQDPSKYDSTRHELEQTASLSIRFAREAVPAFTREAARSDREQSLAQNEAETKARSFPHPPDTRKKLPQDHQPRLFLHSP
jgi:hypothetical protein